MNILFNAFGIQDSGGIRVLEKAMIECEKNFANNFLIICYKNKNIDIILKKHLHTNNFQFKVIQKKGYLHRLYYENIIFRKIIKKHNIALVYNFSGTAQFFSNAPQLVKMHGLVFYSKELDAAYIGNKHFLMWIKQVYLKRMVAKTLVSNSQYFEIQSTHVKNNISHFINTNNKKFYIKSDVDVSDHSFFKPKKYNFTKKIKFLYIVGPHFESVHKNFIDFVNVLAELDGRNIDFEISITLTKDQLENSILWDKKFNSKTNFLGYIADKEKMQALFCDNTIVVSTSIIETLGLHIIEGIKNGVIVIAPDEEYSNAVYGDKIIKYQLFNTESLLNSILNIMDNQVDCEAYILSLQNDLKISENNKYKAITTVFAEILKV